MKNALTCSSSTAPEIQQTAYTRVDKTDGSDELLP